MSYEPRLSSRRVYSGHVLNLDVDRVRFPDGSEGDLEIFRHPGASAVIPFLTDPTADDPLVMLIRQYRYAAEGYLYEIPAGRLDPGEEPAQCANRELLEETGCTAERVEHLTTIHVTPGFTDERIHLFMATGLTRGISQLERDEFIEVQTRPLSEVLVMVERGEITDAKSIVAILFVAGFRLGR
jgi:ADP-ribose pyrophosphatase